MELTTYARALRTTATAVFASAVILVACGEAPEQNFETAQVDPLAVPETLVPSPEALAAAGEQEPVAVVSSVRVGIDDQALDAPTEVTEGSVTFTVNNDSAGPTTVSVEGQNQLPSPATIAADTEKLLTFQLEPGTYTLVAETDNGRIHRQQMRVSRRG